MNVVKQEDPISEASENLLHDTTVKPGAPPGGGPLEAIEDAMLAGA